MFVRDVAAQLPKSVKKKALYTSLTPLAGEKLTPELLLSACWRLAGNLHLLRHGLPIHPWNRQAAPEWVPMQIVRASRARNRKQDLGWNFSFQVMAGGCCPMVLSQFWRERFCWFVARTMGFDRRRPPRYPKHPPQHAMQHCTELISLRLYGLIDPELCGREPAFHKVKMTPLCLKWNHRIMDLRDRLKPGCQCPFNMPESLPCHLCPKGYRSCPAAVHRLDYIPGSCTSCLRTNAPFDPESASEVCVNCTLRRGAARRT